MLFDSTLIYLEWVKIVLTEYLEESTTVVEKMLDYVFSRIDQEQKLKHIIETWNLLHDIAWIKNLRLLSSFSVFEEIGFATVDRGFGQNEKTIDSKSMSVAKTGTSSFIGKNRSIR
jgi:hypothetical protein